MSVREHFINLAALPSPSWHEEAVSGYIKSSMTRCGCQHREDSAGNLLFFRSAYGRKNLLCAHMDVVPKAVDAVLLETEDRFQSDGTTALGADDKCALAAMLELAEEGADCLFLFTRAEETGCKGSALLENGFFSGFDINACFIPDASGDVGAVVTEAPGKDVITLTVHGRAAHAGFSPEKGINAIRVLSEAVSLFPLGRLDPVTTSNIGSFLAPGTINNVPDKAAAELEVRSLNEERREETTRQILRLAEECAAKHGARLEAVVSHAYKGYSIAPESIALREAADAIKALGRRPRLEPVTGGSDTNNLRLLGIDSVTLSAGYHNPHSEREYITKTELETLLRLLRLLSRLPS